MQTAGVVGIIAAWLAVRAAEKEMVAKGHAPELVRDFLGPALLVVPFPSSDGEREGSVSGFLADELNGRPIYRLRHADAVTAPA